MQKLPGVRSTAAVSWQIKAYCGQFALPNVRSPPKTGITRSIATVAAARGSAAMHAKLLGVCVCIFNKSECLYASIQCCVSKCPCLDFHNHSDF